VSCMDGPRFTRLFATSSGEK